MDPCGCLRDILTRLPRATNRQIPGLPPQSSRSPLATQSTLAQSNCTAQSSPKRGAVAAAYGGTAILTFPQGRAGGKRNAG